MKYNYIVKTIKLSRKSPVIIGEDISIEQLIKDMGDNGYRYVGYHPLKVAAYGQFEEINLIFEQSVNV